jgi:hypothetical protein
MPFKAHIYKVGINPCVDVPVSITGKMKPAKGYIPVTGKINGHSFVQTLVPVKNAAYRLYVNMQMLRGGKAKVGDIAIFTLKQDHKERKIQYLMVTALKKELVANKLVGEFDALTDSRKKDILKYLGSIKTEETLTRNILKVIRQLKSAKPAVRIP